MGRNEVGSSSFHPILFGIDPSIVLHAGHGYYFDKDILLLNMEALFHIAPC